MLAAIRARRPDVYTMCCLQRPRLLCIEFFVNLFLSASLVCSVSSPPGLERLAAHGN